MHSQVFSGPSGRRSCNERKERRTRDIPGFRLSSITRLDVYPFRAMPVVPGNSLRPRDYPVRGIPISTPWLCAHPACRSTLTSALLPFPFVPLSSTCFAISPELLSTKYHLVFFSPNMYCYSNRFLYDRLFCFCFRMHVSIEMGRNVVSERSQTTDRHLQERTVQQGQVSAQRGRQISSSGPVS